MSSFIIRQGLVSIIMAAYNSEKYIAQAIASVQTQVYTNWELLIVNDGSTDQTQQIVENLAAQDARIILINQENQGVSKARNAAFAKMQGEFFLIFDSDDILQPQSISSRIDLMQKSPNLYFVDGQVIKKNNDMSATVGTFQPNFKGNPHEALMRLDSRCFGLPSWLIRRQQDKKYQMLTDMSHAEDLLFYIDISTNKKTPADLCRYRNFALSHTR
jgi:teichuronic acid biosynthesis glycosyltransferase TuaG